MRICLYTESALPLVGGQEMVVDRLAREFLNLGHEVIVLAARHRGRAQIRDHELPYKVVRHPRFISTHRCVGWYKWYLGRLHRRFSFEILHCHSVQPTGYAAACWRKPAGTSVVITSHCGEICPGSGLMAKPLAGERCRKALQEADAVVAISEFAEECLRTLYPELKSVERIINGVSFHEMALPAARPVFASQLQANNYFLFLGRIVHQKGVDLLLRAFRQVSANIDAECVIAGDGLDRESMQLLANQLGIGSRVHFVGYVQGNDKTWLLQNAIATVMPSRVSEGCPLVALESFAAGRPVIATRTLGLQELVTPGQTGLLTTAESPTSLAVALTQAATDRANTDRLGKNARAFARQHDWPLVARRYCELFERLADGKSPTAREQRSAA